MAKKDYRLKGHESFVPREGWITKGIHEIGKNSNLFAPDNFYGADDLGVGVNMAKSIRYWMTAMDLVSVKKTAKFTKFGELIAGNDEFVEDAFSLWLMHYNLVNNRSDASSWYVFFQNPIDIPLTRDEWQTTIYEKFEEEYNDYEVNEKSLFDDVNAILSMYSSRIGIEDGADRKRIDPEEKAICPFSSLGLISEKRKKFQRREPNVEDFPEDVMLYVAKKMTVNSTSDKGSISLERLYSGIGGVKNAFNFTYVSMNDILGKLESKKMVRVHRTAGLDTLYLDAALTCEDIIRNHFGGNN